MLSVSFLLFISLQSSCFANVLLAFDRAKSDPNALYAFLKEMPKGGELHYHLSGGAYPETVITVAAEGNYCLTLPDLVMTPPTENCKGVKASEILNDQPLYDKILRAWSMKNFIAGKESGHDHFFATFHYFNAFVMDHHIPLLAEVIARAAGQHEQYMEIMFMPDKARSRIFAELAGTSTDYVKMKEQLLAAKEFAQEIENSIAVADSLLPATRHYLGCEHRPNQAACQLTVRFQYHVLREQPLNNLFAQALHAFAAASRSQAIVGVNLVQAEDGLISLRDYRQQMQVFAFLHQSYPSVHIALHAGELAPADVIPEDLRFHIRDAIRVGHAERIGHGVDIGYEDQADELLKYMAEKPIVVEINLVSNQKILAIKGKKHPLRYYLANNVPVVLSTDDEGILRTDLTTQYVDAVIDHGLDYAAIKQINRNALTYSFLPGKNLWVNSATATLDPACAQLMSNKCLEFVAHSEKARLQRQLELKLIEFERTHNK